MLYGKGKNKMNKKNPYEYISGILQALASDKKRIGFLCGAGTSYARKDETAIYVPSIDKITEKTVAAIMSEAPKYMSAIESIKTEIDKPNIEKILDLIERKIEAVGTGILNGLVREDLVNLKESIQAHIFDSVSVISATTPQEEIKKLPHYDFARWIGKIDRKYPVEVFTTNYDYLFESSFEANEVPYYDGFSGSLSPFFHPLSVEDFSYLPRETKLWKIHGSLGWKITGNKVVRCKTDPSNKELLIYPSSLKYSNSKKMPYVSLIDRLCNFIEQEDSLLIVLGYSFGDEHINERIVTSLKRARNSHVYAFIYDKKNIDGKTKFDLVSEPRFESLANQSSRISFIGMNSVIIGGNHYEWYFDSSRPEVNGDFTKFMVLNEDKTFKELLLPDFVKFVEFITSMMSEIDLGESEHV